MYTQKEVLERMKQAVIERPDDRFSLTYFRLSGPLCKSICCIIGSYIEKYGAETGLQIISEGYVKRIGHHAVISSTEEISIATGISREDIYHLIMPGAYDHYDKREKGPVLARLDELIQKYSGEKNGNRSDEVISRT